MPTKCLLLAGNNKTIIYFANQNLSDKTTYHLNVKTILVLNKIESRFVKQCHTMSVHFQVIIENLVDSVFEDVNHVEEAVVALFSLQNYSKRNNLKRIFKRKTAEVILCIHFLFRRLLSQTKYYFDS